MVINSSENVSDRALAKIQRWKSNFLDLSSRNEQLNFNPKKASHVEIIHPDCSTIFKILVIYDQEMEFPSVFKPKRGQAKEEQKKTHKQLLSKVLNNARLTEMITELSDTKLNRRVKKLIRKGKTAAEEQGINIIYITFGLLKWRERDQGEIQYSPVLFAPVSLKLSPLEITLLDDEIIANPALKEKLLGEQIRLPKFPREFNSRTLINYFAKIENLIKGEKDWELQDRAFIGKFAFTKATLYEDLDDHLEEILDHPIVRAIAEEKGYKEDPSHLPDPETLTDKMDPTHSYLILNADSSQLEAITFAKSGCSLVIQGPPGTGKSQCIANIIAECLGAEKKVLFVAQKQAALNVVKKRLTKSGLDDYCLLVGSQNTPKTEVVTQIQQSLNRDVVLPKVRKSKYNALKIARNHLNEYIQSISHPYGKMQLSLYEIMGILLELENIPLIECEMKNPEQVSESEFETVRNLFEEFEQFRDTLENYDANPWKNAKLTSTLILSPEFKKVLRICLNSFKNANLKFQENLRQFHLKYPPDFERSLEKLPTKWDQIIERLKYWIDILKNLYDIWAQMENDYRELDQYFLLDELLDYKEINFRSFRLIELAYNDQISSKETISSFLLKHLSHYLQKLEDFSNRVTVFNLKSKLQAITSDEDMVAFKTFFNNYKPKALLIPVDELLARFTTDYTSTLKRTGSAYRDDKDVILSCLIRENSRANPMGHLNQIKQFQDKYGRPYDSSRDTLRKMEAEFQDLYDKWAHFRRTEDLLYALLSTPLIPSEYQQKLWDSNHIFAEKWLANLPHLHDWFEVQIRLHHIQDHGFGEMFKHIINKKYISKKGKQIEYAKIFERAFYEYWANILFDGLPPIANFEKKYHQKMVKKFRKLDAEILKLNQQRLQRKLFHLRPQSDLKVSDNFLEQRGFIEREAKKKRNLQPLRTTFGKARDLITTYKPCFMMSPLPIGTYLDLSKYYQFFDIVIFDEASQVTPEDAIGAILRGKSLIVVGDSNQLPPTTFFQAKHSDEFLDESLDVDIQTMESLLDECSGIGFREKMLKFHYRSRKEGLIAFSNQNYYNGKLYTFPDISVDHPILPKSQTNDENENQVNDSIEQELDLELKSGFGTRKSSSNSLENYNEIIDLPSIDFRYVEKGIKKRGKNVIEAEEIAKAIINHYKSNQKYNTNYSLGVVAFSQKQQEAIYDALDEELKKETKIAPIINDDTVPEPLLVKNLESIQGDERDFIFFSIGYAKDSKGKLSYNFGPLNRTGGYRRLNVAITRARFHIKIFSSFLPSEVHLSRVNARGLRDLVLYMRYARTGQLPLPPGQSQSQKSYNLKTFEADVKEALEKHGYQVEELVGTSDYRIDLAVLHPQNPREYILGIECDGGAYQRTPVARDRDKTRPLVMKNLGWHMVHIWAPDWYKNKNRFLNQLKRKITRLQKN